MESVFNITFATGTTLFTSEFQFKLSLLAARQKVFSGRPRTLKAFSGCFCNMPEHRMPPFCVFPNRQQMSLIELIKNMAFG